MVRQRPSAAPGIPARRARVFPLMPMWERACFISDQRLNRLAAGNIRDQSINILDNFLISFFPV